MENRGYRPQPGERSLTREEYRAQQRQARIDSYDAKARTDAQLTRDLDPAPRPGEAPQQAQARARAAQAELDRRLYNQRYAALGEKPPEKFRIADNDALGGGAHTLERHGPHIPLKRRLDASGRPDGTRTIEGRIYGDPPWPRAEPYSFKWLDEGTMDRTVRALLQEHWDSIRATLARGEDYNKTFDIGRAVGEGFRNVGTNAAPNAVYAKTSFVTLRIKAEPNTPGGFTVITTFPNGRGY